MFPQYLSFYYINMQYKYFEVQDNIMQHNDVKMRCDHNQFGIL